MPRPICRTAAAALLLAALSMAAMPASAQADRPEPTIQTLLARPALRPAPVPALKDFNFGGGDSIAKGAELASDEALALTFETLATKSEFWPVRVAVTQTLDFGGGLVIAAGTELPLRTIANGQIEAVYPPAQQPLTLAAEQTDLIARAREIASREPASPPRPHFVRSIEAALDPERTTPALASAEYVLVYRGREGCSRCARFTPELKKAYRKLKQNHTNFEVVFVSDDRSEQSFTQYVSKADMPWKVVPYTNVFAAANTRSLPGRMLPVVYLMSPDGTVIDSTENGSASDVLKTLERELRG